MKVLVLSYRTPPDAGAASARAGSIAEALRKRGHEVDLPRLWVPGLAYRGCLNRFLIYLGFVVSYSRYLLMERPKPDILYYVSPWALSPLSFPAMAYARMRGIRSALDVHDLIHFSFLSPLLADKIIHVEDSLAGTDMDFLVDNLSHGFGIPPDGERKTVLVMCSGNPQGYDAEAFNEVAEMVPTADFEIRKFGNGSRSEYLSDLSRADIFLCPARKRFDQMPTKVADYMVLGRPTVYLGNGKMGHILEDHIAGFRADDIEEAAAFIDILAADSELRRLIGANAKRTAEDLFSLDAFGLRLETMLK